MDYDYDEIYHPVPDNGDEDKTRMLNEIQILNTQTLQLEESLEEAKLKLKEKDDEFRERKKESDAKATEYINSIFGAIPVRGGSLESGRFVIRTKNSKVQAYSPKAASPAPVTPQPITRVPSKKPTKKDKKGLAISSTAEGLMSMSEADSELKVFSNSTMIIRETADKHIEICGMVRFKNVYPEPPIVSAWIQYKSFFMVRKVTSNELSIYNHCFTFKIRQDEVSMIDEGAVNWLAITPAACNSDMDDISQIILAHRDGALPSDLEKAVNKFIKQYDVNTNDSNGVTLLHHAAGVGNTRLVKHLLGKGADINITDNNGFSALLGAIASAQYGTALFLMQQNCDISAISNSDNNCLHYLCKQTTVDDEYLELLKQLLARGVDVNRPNGDGDTPFALACKRSSSIEPLKQLQRAGAKVNTVNNIGMSPLHFSIRSEEKIKLLCEWGADPDIGHGYPKGTAIEFAQTSRAPLIVKFLMEAKKKLAEARKKNGNVEEGMKTCVQCVIVEGRGFKDVTNVYCISRIGDIQQNTEASAYTADPHWESVHEFDDVTDTSLNIVIWGMSSGNETAPSNLGYVQIDIEALKNQGTQDKWYTVYQNGCPKKGELHIKCQVAVVGKDEKAFAGKASLSNSSFVDVFSTVTFPKEEWIQLEPEAIGTASLDMRCLDDGFHIENHAGCVSRRYETHVPFSAYQCVPHYEKYFSGVPHKTYQALFESAPIIISLEENSSNSPVNPEGMRKMILRQKKEDECMFVPQGKNDIQIIKNCVASLQKAKLTQMSHTPDLIASLKKFDKLTAVTRYKFGIVYAAPGQRGEREFLSNSKGSPLFEQFLLSLGECVLLQGFNKYPGGLDTKYNNTGLTSIYTEFYGAPDDPDTCIPIMFHVSTMLPHKETDEQQLEKKRHIGNDVVVIIFKEQDSPDDVVDVTSFVSHFNHIFAIVTPIQTPYGMPQRYRVTLAYRESLRPFPPYFPDTGNEFVGDHDFRDWLLKKLINGERTAMGTPQFLGSLMRTRKQMLGNIIDEAKK